MNDAHSIRFRSFLVAGLVLASAEVEIRAQTWRLTGAPMKVWTALACSADGERILAASREGFVFTSTNFGITWRSNSVPVTNWTSVASSADGETLFILAPASRFPQLSTLYTSTNAGTTWEPMTAPATNWTCVASSADGTRLVGAAFFGKIYTSTNSGADWSTTSAPNEPWTALACSADGHVITAIGAFPDVNPSPVAVSADAGATWVVKGLPGWLLSPACPADGSRALLGTASRGVLQTIDSGVTWTLTALPNDLDTRWSGVAASADGTRWAAAVNQRSGSGASPEMMYLSGDSAASWASANAPATNWAAVGCSADGCKLVAAVGGYEGHRGGIYTCQLTPTPVMHATPSGNNLLLSWVLPSRTFVLQESPDPAQTNWLDVPAVPTLNPSNLQQQVLLSRSDRMKFFRLVSR